MSRVSKKPKTNVIRVDFDLRREIEAILDCQYAFRDYEIRSKKLFGTINKIAVHQVLERENLEYDIDSAIQTFSRDGFPCVVFYV